MGFSLKNPAKTKGKVCVYADRRSSRVADTPVSDARWRCRRAGPSLPHGTANMGPDRPAGSHKNSSIIHFWFSLSTPHIPSIIPQAVPSKEHFKVGKIRKKENSVRRFPSPSLIKADVIPQPDWPKHTPEIPALTFAASYGSKDTFVFLVSACCLICDSRNVSAWLITSRLNFPN